MPWKKFNSHMAISVEYDLEYWKGYTTLS
jgi:hypothetical protein